MGKTKKKNSKGEEVENKEGKVHSFINGKVQKKEKRQNPDRKRKTLLEPKAETLKKERKDDNDEGKKPKNKNQTPEKNRNSKRRNNLPLSTAASEDISTEAPEETSEKILRHESKPENTIFVGNLPTNTKQKQLKMLFEKFGKVVSVRLRTSLGKRLFKHTMRKKTESLNGYVVFESIESKEKALKLTGTEFKARHIRVTSAQDLSSEPKRTVFVGNLKYNATDEKLHEIFSTCGDVDYVRTIRNEKGCTGVAYVCFKKPEAVSLALDLNDTMLDERPIRVQRYKKNDGEVKGGKKVLSGPARRMSEKKNKQAKGGKSAKSAAPKKSDSPRKEKKSDFHGKKISTTKKKPKDKKKKVSHLQKLANKIAPK